ncbi:MAG TPA: hypothetical protein PLF42_02305 [Anaerolineales bacterium]|jgi:hypothetical protein|nr:hypothetical protein [Anaerolineales bacterium]
MADELQKWEYLVQSVGNIFGVKDEDLEAALNELGEEGWEAVNVYVAYGSGKATVVVKRPLTRETIRRRSMPQYKY